MRGETDKLRVGSYAIVFGIAVSKRTRNRQPCAAHVDREGGREGGWREGGGKGRRVMERQREREVRRGLLRISCLLRIRKHLPSHQAFAVTRTHRAHAS